MFCLFSPASAVIFVDTSGPPAEFHKGAVGSGEPGGASGPRDWNWGPRGPSAAAAGRGAPGRRAGSLWRPRSPSRRARPFLPWGNFQEDLIYIFNISSPGTIKKKKKLVAPSTARSVGAAGGEARPGPGPGPDPGPVALEPSGGRADRASPGEARTQRVGRGHVSAWRGLLVGVCFSVFFFVLECGSEHGSTWLPPFTLNLAYACSFKRIFCIEPLKIGRGKYHPGFFLCVWQYLGWVCIWYLKWFQILPFSSITYVGDREMHRSYLLFLFYFIFLYFRFRFVSRREAEVYLPSGGML